MNYIIIIFINDNSIAFELTQLTGSRGKGQSPTKKYFDKFEGDPFLCVYSVINLVFRTF